FFFSSRRRHTRSKRDWSSDVCSSDLRERLADHWRFYVGAAAGLVVAVALGAVLLLGGSHPGHPRNPFTVPRRAAGDRGPLGNLRSEERRVGKEGGVGVWGGEYTRRR